MNIHFEKSDWSVIALWLLLGLWALALNITPASLWFEVRNVHVNNAVVGQAPVMVVDREIKRPFHGDWTAEVERSDGNGFYATCSQSGSNSYNLDNVLPSGNKLNLNWWTWPRKCQLSPGRYRVSTEWIIQTGFLGERIVRSVSNTFLIQ